MWQWLTNKTTTQTGQFWEQFALDYLHQQGLILVSQNYHCRFGEIDLIMQDKDTLVFVEVKYRKDQQFGGALAAVSKAKQQKIKKTASIYLQQHQLNEYNTAYRFDIVAIERLANESEQPQVHWLTNAFN
ncbi:YraN family protein [Thalassotalea ganghwensis]